MEQLGEATSGGMGAIVSTVSMYPLISTKIRLQAQRKASKQQRDDENHRPYKGTVDCLLRICKEDGVAHLFSGIHSALFKAFCTNFIFYYCFSSLKFIFQPKHLPKPGMLKSMLHGICAGICVQLIMAPIDMVNTRLVVSKGKGNFMALLRSIVQERGLFGLWSGIAPALVLTLNPGITNVVRNLLTPADGKATATQNFWIGAASKAVASSCTYPYVVAKVAMQTADKDTKSDKKPHTTAHVMRTIVEQEGVQGLYKGLSVQLGTAVMKEAILNMVRVEINRYVMAFFRMLAQRGGRTTVATA